MKKNRYISISRVVIVILGTVVLGSMHQAYAADSVRIVNSVQSSTHTGGQSSSGGQPGQAGQAGADGSSGVNGVDGADGVSGTDGTVINGDSVSRTYIQSTVGTESVTDHSVSFNGSTTSATTTIEYDDSSTNDLIIKLRYLQLILSKYVSLLF